MSSKQFPASIRYLKARLKILQRPSVWVSASVLVGAIVLLTETWKYPEKFAVPNESSFGESVASDSENAETGVRPAPLDPLSAAEEPLFGAAAPDAQSQSSPLTSRNFTGSSQADELASPLLLPRPSASRSATSSLVPDPFASIRTTDRTSTGNGSTQGTASSESSGASGFSSGNLSGNSPNSSSERAANPNPLQSALDRYASPSSAQPSSSPLPQSNSFSAETNSTETNSSGMNGADTPQQLQAPVSPSLGQLTPGQSIPGQSSFVQPQPLPGQPSYGQTQPPPQFIPQTSPAPGTTGYTLPPAFRTNTNSSTGSSFDSGGYDSGGYDSGSYSPSGVPTTGFSSTVQPAPSNATVQPQVSQPQTAPAPFSIPRAVPGRSIGGGQINTFSNP